MKRTLAAILTLSMTAALCACGSGSGGGQAAGGADKPAADNSSAASGDVLELKFSDPLDSGHPGHLGAVYFGERLEELSGGTMKTTDNGNSALGDEQEVVEMQSYGDSITFSLPSGNSLQNFSPAFYAVDFYFALEDYDQVWKLYDGEFGQYLKDSLDGTGLVVTSFWDNGFRNLTTTNKEVHTVADIKNLKIRVMNAETHLAAWKAMGAAATPIAYSEVYSALQQGVVEGQENPLSNIIGSKFNEVQKYLIMTRHVHDVAPFIISGKAWDSWTDEQKAWVQQASDEAAEYMRDLASKLEEENLQKLIDGGMTVIELTDEERQTFKDAVAGVAEQFKDKMGEEAFAKYQECIAKVTG